MIEPVFVIDINDLMKLKQKQPFYYYCKRCGKQIINKTADPRTKKDFNGICTPCKNSNCVNIVNYANSSSNINKKENRMNNELIMLIGFGTGAFIVAFFATITIVLLLKGTKQTSGLNNNVYDADQMKETLAKKCTSDAIKMKGNLEHPFTLENGEYRIFRPKKFITSFMPPTLISHLGKNTGKYLFGIETLYKASSKTTESIIEYIDTVKQFVRSDIFTSLATSEKQYITIRIEEQLCKIIFKYIDGNSNKLNEGDKAIILDALDL